MIKDQEKLVIGRRWNNAHIYTEVSVNNQRIEMQMPAESLAKAISLEIGSPFFLMTTAQLEKKLVNALQIVFNEIKKASAEVV